MKATAPRVDHYNQEESGHITKVMNGREKEGKNESGKELPEEGGGLGGALGLLFLQQTAPGHPRGDITQAITHRIAELLSVQLVVEEKVLFPVLQAFGEGGRALVAAARAEHPAVMTGLAELQSSHYTQPTFGPTIEPLISLIAKRSDREEVEIQPFLQRHLDPDDYTEVGRLVDRVREVKGADESIVTRVRALTDKLRAT